LAASFRFRWRRAPYRNVRILLTHSTAKGETMIKKTSITLAAILTLSACGDSEPPIKIEAYNEAHPILPYAKYAKIKVSSLIDSVSIEDIIVNRGNCKVEGGKNSTYKIIPKELKFGESVSVGVTNCNVLQVDVVTNKGDWSETYQ